MRKTMTKDSNAASSHATTPLPKVAHYWTSFSLRTSVTLLKNEV